MILPEHFESKNVEKIRQKVDVDIKLAKVKVARDRVTDFKINKNRFQKSLLTDRHYIYSLGMIPIINSIAGASYKKELTRKARLLSILKDSSSNFYKTQVEFGINKDIFSHEPQDLTLGSNIKKSKHGINMLLDQTIEKIQNSFDVDTNVLIPEAEKTKEMNVFTESEISLKNFDQSKLRKRKYSYTDTGDDVFSKNSHVKFDNNSRKNKRRKHH